MSNIENFLGTNIGFLNVETKFFCNILLYNVDLNTRIDEKFNQMLAKLSWILDLCDLLEFRLI